MAILPLAAAAGAWGLVTGVAMVKAGLTEPLAVGMTLLVFAASAQLTALPLMVSEAPLWLIFAAGLVVNLRFVIFSAALQPYFRHLSWPRRLLLGYITTDLMFVLFMNRYSAGGPQAPEPAPSNWTAFMLGGGLAGWTLWQTTSLLGIYLGTLVPSDWSLEFAAVLALLAVVVPMVVSRPMACAAVAAGVVAWLGQPLPLRLGLVGAVIAGVIAGLWAERAQAAGAAR